MSLYAPKQLAWAYADITQSSMAENGIAFGIAIKINAEANAKR